MGKSGLGERRTLIWRLAPLVFLGFLWIVYYISPGYGTEIYSFLLLKNVLLDKFVITGIIFGITAVLMFFFPYRFYIHAVFCLSWSLLRIIDGSTIYAFLLYLLGFIFLYRQGFFKNGGRIKLVIGGLLLVTAFLTQLHFGYIMVLLRFVWLIISVILGGIAIVVLNPEILEIRMKKRGMVLRLSPDKFTKEDVEILTKILAGEKYESIAIDEKKSMSTFKRYIQDLYHRLQVNDRTGFLTTYANYQIVLEQDDT